MSAPHSITGGMAKTRVLAQARYGEDAEELVVTQIGLRRSQPNEE